MKAAALRRLSIPCFAALALASTALAAAAPVASAAPAYPVTVTSHFVVTGDPTVIGDSAYLDNGATDGHPRDLVYVTLNMTPGGVCVCASFPTTLMGVWYDTSRKEWAVFNENFSNMPAAPSFNVLVVPKPSKYAFVVTATGSNTHGSDTFLKSRLLNGNPRAIIQVTQNYNPGGTLAGTNDPHPVGVRYFAKAKQWAIFNEDGAHIPIDAAFDVLIGSAGSNGGKTAVTSYTAADKGGLVTINNPETNGNPNNVTFVTQNYNPNGKGGTTDAHPLEVLSTFCHKLFCEAVTNIDFTVPHVHAAFNLLIFPS